MVFVFVATAVEFFAATEGVYLFFLEIGFVQLADHTRIDIESPGHLNSNIKYARGFLNINSPNVSFTKLREMLILMVFVLVGTAKLRTLIVGTVQC